MKVVLDTNVLLQSVGKTSIHRPIWELFIANEITLIVSSSILLEYEEIIARKASARAAEIVIKILLESPSVQFVQPYFEWNIISTDPDDNKFFDAAIAGNADFIVTNDGHFNAVKRNPFPPMSTISSNNFLSLIIAVHP